MLALKTDEIDPSLDHDRDLDEGRALQEELEDPAAAQDPVPHRGLDLEEDPIGALKTKMKMMGLGFTLLTWTVRLASEIWKSYLASTVLCERFGWPGLFLALLSLSFATAKMQKRPSEKLMGLKSLVVGFV